MVTAVAAKSRVVMRSRELDPLSNRATASGDQLRPASRSRSSIRRMRRGTSVPSDPAPATISAITAVRSSGSSSATASGASSAVSTRRSMACRNALRMVRSGTGSRCAKATSARSPGRRPRRECRASQITSSSASSCAVDALPRPWPRPRAMLPGRSPDRRQTSSWRPVTTSPCRSAWEMSVRSAGPGSGVRGTRPTLAQRHPHRPARTWRPTTFTRAPSAWTGALERSAGHAPAPNLLEVSGLGRRVLPHDPGGHSCCPLDGGPLPRDPLPAPSRPGHHPGDGSRGGTVPPRVATAPGRPRGFGSAPVHPATMSRHAPGL